MMMLKKKDAEYSKTLPPELIRPIVLYLKNDKKSLHSCLLVSRDWCKETVDLLWKQPFHFLYTCNKINSSVLAQFTNPKLNNQCHCSNEKRQYQATNLLMTYLSIKHGIITFDYFEFLRVLDLHELYCAIKDWNQWNKFNKDNSSPLTFKSIIRHFFTNTPNLKILSLDTKFISYKINNKNPCSFLVKLDKYDKDDDDNDYYFSYCDHYILELLIKETKFPDTIQFFINLTELVLIIKESKYKIFSSLSQICHNIQKLIVKINFPTYVSCGFGMMQGIISEVNHLASLIRSQHNLVHFELFDIPETGINKILESLKESQHNSLKTLILNNALISYNNSTILFYLKYLQNLQELKFNKCICNRNIFYNNKYNKIDIFDEEKNYEEGLWLPNLKYLQVDYIDENEELLLEKHHSQTRQWIERNSTQIDGTHTQILLTKELLLEKHHSQTRQWIERNSTQIDGTHNPNTVDEGTATRETSFPDTTMDRAKFYSNRWYTYPNTVDEGTATRETSFPDTTMDSAKFYSNRWYT
ncbi:hypothetical protein RirG_032170 [Rhizophagus irregularis DAOM 197198w]|uniref:F-box domain-containing protein n=1 Tax=Rhizophagus irregularis (strain DAOM 197198w) TaxID=1432141 RepID=A0A015NBG0_RHIIW|nr:hypothetical protein RirG_032170 [Rhizophagus irregularis DAOM 197198w]